MCRNIKTLHNFDPPASDEEIYLSSLQFVRKLSGFTRPSAANQAAFDRAVTQGLRGSARADRFARHHRPAPRPRGRGRQSPREVCGAVPLRMTVELQRTSALSSKTPSVQELLQTLVGFDTTSAKSNLALIALRRGLPQGPRHRLDARPLPRRHQGRSVRHHRRDQRRRHRALGPQRLRAGRRPALDAPTRSR